MRTVGLIVEYNPLHHGHVYHFQQSKHVTGAERVIAVMSGHFLQRGEPALVSKWARTEMALKMGVDLVIELPVAFAVQPAEWFAYGAVSALEATGITDAICFGSEHGSLDSLQQMASLLANEPEHFQHRLQQQLKAGIAYPAAYAAAAADCFTEQTLTSVDDPALGAAETAANAAWMAQPNNSLGLHYLIALQRLSSPIQPYTIQRQKADYHQQTITDTRIASATAIRKLLQQGNWSDARAYFPAFVWDILQREVREGRGLMEWERFYSPLMHLLHALPVEALSTFQEVSEGLEHRIKQQLPSYEGNTVQGFVEKLKTRRYTWTKIQRMLLRILLQHHKHALAPPLLAQGVPYLRILGFSRQGRDMLKEMKKTARVPVILQGGRESNAMLEMDIRASAVYAHAYPESQSAKTGYRDYFAPPLQE
ncbi:nucleotidyltransferase [Marinicrinis sediminis]|uniref:tRNA(Met) cytidine acetate ligase n=1 Tax=Marinicrinis sediminis TaxID=1652465 RepID=A0ABW5R6H9_9BACL